MLNLKRLSHFSLVLLLALTVFSPLQAEEDDMPVSDEEIIVPQGSNSGTPPVIIDDSRDGIGVEQLVGRQGAHLGKGDPPDDIG